jgi:hypothetical protein
LNINRLLAVEFCQDPSDKTDMATPTTVPSTVLEAILDWSKDLLLWQRDALAIRKGVITSYEALPSNCHP